ncbi:uncharacterized protein LOC141627181 [Silene latifolia]|uniref:uncharacterized protein LOC141627181 n=1 Tax=Silene latifolia TaxID=37657 RepID=UPI003D783F0E
MKTVRDAWRVHKCRFKKKHFYRHKDDKSRWRNRSNLVPDDDFLKLLATWKKKSEKRRCSRNRDRRLAQKNMHTAGPKSFAVIREELTNENPDKEPPSLAKMFEHTRERKTGKKYKESYDDTERKITEMKTYVPDDGECQPDPFLGVMGKEYDGRRRLFGRGVSNKKLKEVNGTQTSYVVPGEILESLKTSLREDLRKDMDYEMSRRNKEQEEEYLKRKAELETMEKDIENERELMREQILTKFLERLPPEVVKEYLSGS